MDHQSEKTTRADIVVRYKARFSLITLWVFAGIVFIMMIVFNALSIKSSAAESYLNSLYPVIDRQEEKTALNNEKNDKRFFLTRLPSIQPKSEKTTEKQAMQQVLVIRKLKMTTSRANDGFQIKPLPQ